MDQLDPNHKPAVPDRKAAASPIDPPAAVVDAPESLGHATPLGLRSSPPPLRPPTDASFNRAVSHAESVAGSQSDSEAETVVLPGVDGFSPSKIRKERNIKLEDRGIEFGQEIDNDGNAPRNNGDDESAHQKRRESALPSENAASLLGKRKRTKHGIARLDDTHGGNSSGLSSVPTSPVAHARSNLAKRADSESEGYRSSSPRKAASERPTKNKRSTDSASERDKEFKRTHARRSSARDTSGVERHGERRTKLPGEASTRRRRTLSPSPTREREKSDNLSGNRSASSGAANGLGSRKKSIPPPLRPIKSNHSADSDDSSAVESPYPRRSKTRHQGTPPTGGSMQKMAHRRRQNRYGRTPLADATEAGNLEKTKQLLAEFPEDLDVPDAAGNTPLQCAALNGHGDIVKLLIMSGCNIDCKNNDGDSPLLDAVENCHLEVVRLLLDAGVDPRARNQRGEEPLVKVDEDHEDAEEIKAALQAAKVAHAARFRPIDAAHTPQQELIESTNRKSMSHGRANRTGQSLLYTQFDVHGLRDAAAKGDTERIVNILEVLGNFDDAEATLAAAKGGHIDALEMMFGLGNANPDPAPVKGQSWEFATPMLAAIGGDNTKVVKLLLQQAKDRKFDPTKTFRGKSYYEIAKERAGPVWMEEERLLKEAYDEYAARSPASTRSNGSRSKNDDGNRTKSSKRETRGPDMSSPVRRAPGRSRKDANDDSEHEMPSKSSQREEEADQAKPRRKLISGRELKDAAQEKSKPTGSITPSPPKPEKSSLAQRDQKLATEKKSSHDPEAMEGVEVTRGDQVRTTRKEKSSERAPSIRQSSPAKRPRQISPTPSEPTDLGKRRRTESETKRRRQSDVGQGTAAEKRSSMAPNKEVVFKEKTSPVSVRGGQAYKKDTMRSDTPEPMDIDKAMPTRSSPGRVRQKPTEKAPISATTDDTTQYVGQKRKVELEAEVKSAMTAATAKRRETDRQNDEAARKSDAERKADAEADARRQAEEREKKRAMTARRLEEEVRSATLDAYSALEIPPVIQPNDINVVHEAREDHGNLIVGHEENGRREIEADELREQQRREASAQRHREEEKRAAEKAEEEEHKRALREDMQRREQAEKERKKRELLQERSRLKREKEEARRSKLPPLLRWWETAEKVDTPEIASCFAEMFAARYDTIVPDEAKRDPNIDGREQYILNTHAACLLGEKDLELTRYTGWERVPASKWALHGFWRLESDLYSMTEPGLDIHSPDLLPYLAKQPLHSIDPNVYASIRRAAKDLFINLPLFFVKLSDVMFVVSKKPHLRDVKMVVNYHEALPDESYVLNWQKKSQKWKLDPGSRTDLGWCPGPKTYINGICIDQVTPQKAQWTVRPYPEAATPQRKYNYVASPPPQQAHNGEKHDATGEAMDVDSIAASSSPARAPTPVRHPLPSSAPTHTDVATTNGDRDADADMHGHFAGEFAGWSMHGATGERPGSAAGAGASGVNGEVGVGPGHPSLPTCRSLGGEGLGRGEGERRL